MKKLILPLLLMGGAGLAQAQNLSTAGKATLGAPRPQPAARVACTGDEVDYNLAKNIGTSVRLIGMQANQTTAISAGAQYFPAPQSMTISGFWVLGRKPTAGTITMKGSIYSTTTDSLPNLELGSGTVTLSTVTTALTWTQVTFATPVTVTQPFVLSFENQTASPAYQIATNYFTNNGDTASGRGERLARARYSNQWYNPALLFTGFDADFIISPIVTYNVASDFTVSNTTPCVNTPVTLTNTSSPIYSSRFYNVYAFNNHFFSVPDSTFRWTLPSGTQYSTNATLNSATPGAVNAKLKATMFTWAIPDCIDSITKTVTYNALDNATFSFPSNTFCSGAANPVPTVSSPGTFSGSAGLNFVSTTTGEIDLSTTANGTYTVTYTTSGACPGTSNQTVTVTSAPDADFTYSAAAFCVGGTNPFPVFGAGAGAGAFSSTTGLAINGGTGEINLATSTPGTYTVTNAIAASGSCAASSSTFNVTINARPTATLSGGGAICAGSGNSVNVSVALTGTGPWTVVASNGSTTFPAVPVTTSPYTLPVNEAAAGTYTIVTVTDALCSNSGTGSATVTVNPSPTVNAVANVSVCNGIATSAINFGGPVAGTTYAWSNSQTGIGLGASGNGNIPSFTASNTTGSAVTSTVTVTPTAAGCVGTPATFTITVNPSPAVAFTGVPALVCVYGDDVTLNGGTPAGGSYSGTGVTGTTFDPAAAGVGTKTLTYTYTDAGTNCAGIATATIEVSQCLGVDENTAAGNLVLYPNPAAGQVTFRFQGNSVEQATVTILSLDGKVVYQNRFNGNQGTIDVSTLARSTYFVRIKANDKETTSKLVLN